MCRQLLHLYWGPEDPEEDPDESEEDSEDPPEEDPEESEEHSEDPENPWEDQDESEEDLGECVWDPIENLEAILPGITPNESRLRGIILATALVSVLVGVVVAYLVY